MVLARSTVRTNAETGSRSGLALLESLTAGELQENLLEILPLRLRLRLQLVHGANGDELTPQDDPDPIAELLRDFEGVGGYEDRQPRIAVVPEDLLDEAGASGVQAHHRLVDHHHLRLVEEG